MSLKERIINAFELKGGVNGLKMIIGAMLIVAAHQIDALRDLATNYPDLVGNVQSAVDFIQKIMDWMSFILERSGQLTLFVGFIGKFFKFFKFFKK